MESIGCILTVRRRREIHVGLNLIYIEILSIFARDTATVVRILKNRPFLEPSGHYVTGTATQIEERSILHHIIKTLGLT